MKKWILENIGTKPVAVVAGILMIYFIYSEKDKQLQIKSLNEQLRQKDQIINQQNIREQNLSDRLMEYVFKFQKMDNSNKESDSLLKEKTEPQVIELLKKK